MKTLALMLIAISALLSGCVAYEAPYRDGGGYRTDREHDRQSDRMERNRDGDAAPNRQDRRPDDDRRY